MLATQPPCSDLAKSSGKISFSASPLFFGVPADSMSKETRNRATAVNFGIVYGISPFGLAAQLSIPQAEARAYIDRYFARYQGVQAFIEKTLSDTRREGSVRTFFGRVRPIPDIESRNSNARGFAERTAVNTPPAKRAGQRHSTNRRAGPL